MLRGTDAEPAHEFAKDSDACEESAALVCEEFKNVICFEICTPQKLPSNRNMLLE